MTDALDGRDLGRLAELQCRYLPTSLVSRFGPGYARAFFRFVAASEEETLLAERADGVIVGACVLSWSPATLSRRLLLRTPLLAWLPLRVRHLPWRGVVRGLLGPAGEESVAVGGAPEIVLIFVDAAGRSRGIGTRLLARCESILRERGMDRYVVRTDTADDAPAVRFYRRNGFLDSGYFRQHGSAFRLMSKHLAPCGPVAASAGNA